MARITTTSPPVAHPKRASGTVGTSLASIISVDDYQVTRTVAGVTSTEVVTGIGEITSPLFLCNRSALTCHVSVQITRSGGSSGYIIYQQDIPAGETLQVPLNGTALLTGDLLRLVAETASSIDYTIAWAQGEAEGDGT